MMGKQRGRLEGSEDKFCLTLLVIGECFCERGSQRVGNYFLNSRKDGEQLILVNVLQGAADDYNILWTIGVVLLCQTVTLSK